MAVTRAGTYAAAAPVRSSLARVTTNLVGGLGNQLFLIANLLAISRRCGVAAVLPRVAYSSSSGPPRPTYWSSMFAQLHAFGVDDAPASHSRSASSGECANDNYNNDSVVVLVPETRPVAPVWLDATRACTYCLVGFFQSSVYFDDAAALVRRVPPPPLRRAAAALLRHYCCHRYDDDDKGSGSSSSDRSHLACRACVRADYHCVGVHVRRGDYVAMPDVFALLSHDYYDAALRQLLGRWLLRQPPQQQQPQATSHAQQQTVTHDGRGSALRVLVFCEDATYGDLLVGYLRCKYAGLHVTLVCAQRESAAWLRCAATSCSDDDDDHALLLRDTTTHTQQQQQQKQEQHDHTDGALPLLSLLQRTPRDVLELLMLAACDDVVMANSTFSWWGAYLNERPLRRVVAPARWFASHAYTSSQHLYCDDWLVV